MGANACFRCSLLDSPGFQLLRSAHVIFCTLSVAGGTDSKRLGRVHNFVLKVQKTPRDGKIRGLCVGWTGLYHSFLNAVVLSASPLLAT
jgi:hypothetical protein